LFLITFFDFFLCISQYFSSIPFVFPSISFSVMAVGQEWLDTLLEWWQYAKVFGPEYTGTLSRFPSASEPKSPEESRTESYQTISVIYPDDPIKRKTLLEALNELDHLFPDVGTIKTKSRSVRATIQNLEKLFPLIEDPAQKKAITNAIEELEHL